MSTSQEKNETQKLKGMVKMEKMSKAEKKRITEKMSDTINDYILHNDFLMGYIRDGVKELIYDEREYYPDMINEVIENDLTAGYNGGYIVDIITNEINTIPLVDRIHELFKEEFNELANQCNN